MRLRAAGIQNLLFKGFVPFDEVGNDFNRASFLVNTSDSEGFPNTFMQAWARGIPSLSFVRPQVREGQTQTLPCEDWTDMRQQLLNLAQHPGQWLQASQACLQHFEHTHSKKAVLPRYREIFSQVLGTPAPALWA
jgi:glycosyltransferase involved in cell wall biosynthesis